IGGIYAWRLSPQSPPQYRPKTEAEFQRLLKEAEFTFRQAFAFCPYSPEALFRYVNLLLPLNRVDDALLLAETCLKLDPYNAQVIGLVDNLRSIKNQMSAMQPGQRGNDLPTIEAEVRRNPNNSQAAVQLAGVYVQMQQTGRAIQLLDTVLSNPAAPPTVIIHAAQLFNQLAEFPKLEAALERLTQVSPESPEAWYDLAAMKANLGKNSEALTALKRCLELNAARLQTNPSAPDLSKNARQELRFSSLRSTPEFKQLLP
ncbi:MAG TPA: tetratricopeptide repeat protein, partial [Patescibacteria group bacterium]|nr:tetratricopeptide repeat protein [Patescibacteria group bacterium]